MSTSRCAAAAALHGTAQCMAGTKEMMNLLLNLVGAAQMRNNVHRASHRDSVGNT